ncbi:MAG: IMPACT family protein [Spirochaetia bacterium]
MAKILVENVHAQIEVKKSRFLATLGILENVSNLKSLIQAERKAHHKAAHVCSAYIMKNGHAGSNDDGEPHGTAGRPMLECLIHSELVNVYILVTRYFGGTLLGKGGLVHAYQDAVKAVLLQAKTKEFVALVEGSYSLSYTQFSQIKDFLDKEAFIYEVHFDTGVHLTYSGKKESCDLLGQKIKALG